MKIKIQADKSANKSLEAIQLMVWNHLQSQALF
jgi:hypothetical protein